MRSGRIECLRLSVERCLYKAANASSKEIEAVWLSHLIFPTP
jgi:hypothetical protein